MRLTPSHEWPYGKPVPVSALFDVGTLEWSVTFDMGLRKGPLNAMFWNFRKANNRYFAVTAAALGPVVSGIASFMAPDPGLDVVNYGPTISDVISHRGEAADSFSNFPLGPAPPPTKPIPLLAQYNPATNFLIVTFDQLLRNRTLFTTNWSVWYNQRVRIPFAFSAQATDVLGVCTMGPPWITPDKVTYHAYQPDVEGRTGLFADPFADFPIT